MKNIKKWIISILSIIFVIIASIYSKNELFNSNTNKPTSNSNTDINVPYSSNLELTEAKITKVIDGDTVWVDIGGKSFKVRLIGINCPEYTKEIEPYGKEATEYTKNNLEGKTVYLMKDVSDTDDYDRLLRYVWTKNIDEITEENIYNYLFNAKLVQEGLAHSNYYKPDITLQDYLEGYETEAKNTKKGMWQ